MASHHIDVYCPICKIQYSTSVDFYRCIFCHEYRIPHPQETQQVEENNNMSIWTLELGLTIAVVALVVGAAAYTSYLKWRDK